ncbi:unnamed protein product [Sphagnum jensenii]|uniref:Reverse transcriptase domain-containing protein n=2 Tax=Sphagnum jensenii TaxID=128206 RepID=A0ABP0WW50_9BRYO
MARLQLLQVARFLRHVELCFGAVKTLKSCSLPSWSTYLGRNSFQYLGASSTQLPFWRADNCNTRLVPFVYAVKELPGQIHSVCSMSTYSKWAGNHAAGELENFREFVDPDLYMRRRYDQNRSSGTESEDDEGLGRYEGADQHDLCNFSEMEGVDDEGGTYTSGRHDEYDSDSSNETESDDGEGQVSLGFPHQYGAGSSGETESDSDEWQAPCQGLDRLQQLKPNADGKYEKLIDILCDPLVLEAAYEHIKTWCSPDQRLQLQVEDPGHSWFEIAAEQLHSGTYVFKPVKHIEVRRAARSRATKQLSVIRLRDQIIQEAMRTILEWIYEPMFSEHAHGFRPGKGVHSALRSIKKTWRGVSWFLQFDIQKSDDTTLIQQRLMRVLSERIEDKCFMDLLKQMFKVGIVCVDIFADEEIPQGSCLSPILGNIYLIELDEEVVQIMKEFDSEYEGPQGADKGSVGREDRGRD